MTSKTLFSLLKEMARVRVLSLITIVWFTLLFNVERIDINEKALLNLSNVTYALAVFIGIGLLAFPNLGSQKIIYSTVLILVFYFLSGWIYFKAGWSNRPFYSYFIEVFVLWVTLILMRRVSYTLLDFEQAFQVFVLDVESSRIQPYEEGKAEGDRELDRGRRFGHQMAFVACAIHNTHEPNLNIITDAFNEDIPLSFERRHRHIQLARSVAALSYKSDIIIDYGDWVVLCLPETTPEEAAGFIQQLYTFVDMVLDDDLLIGIANYPDDGTQFDDLVRAAKDNAQLHINVGEGADKANRQGALLVDMDQRLKIEQESAWLQKLAYQSPSARLIYQFLKRAIDILAVVMIFPALLPIMGITALLIYLDDRTPIFYMQERTGYGGRRFKMYKFRSMRVGSKPVPPEVVHTESGEVRYVWPEKTSGDDRITRVGRILRKTSLDELPQLLNVLKGDMSLVGPRPTTWEVKMYTLHQTERLTVRPGITGLWQVCARESTNFDERLLWDLKYVEKMSLWLDIQIIFRTVAQVFKKGGV